MINHSYNEISSAAELELKFDRKGIQQEWVIKALHAKPLVPLYIGFILRVITSTAEGKP